METITENKFREYQAEYESIIEKGSILGDMELLDESDKLRFIQLAEIISGWEAANHPLPGRISTLITEAIKEKMREENLRQKEAAKILGISESRISDLLNGRRPLNLNIVKRLRDKLGIPADFILDNI